MKKLIVLSLCGGLAAATSPAIDLKQSTLTQVVNDVQIISAADRTKKNAAVSDVFNIPDILRTGAASRAELVAADETVTRVGANTIFSFDPASRTIDLKQGSLLFHSPHGKGGGTIHTSAATASVLGTTLIVTTTANGGMKVLDLEGSVQVSFASRLRQKLAPGEMTFVLPGGAGLAPVIIFRLDEVAKNSLLVKGFSQPLSSLPLIQKQVEKQGRLIKSGRATDTGLLVGEDASPSQVQVVDVNTIQASGGGAELRAALAADATISQPSLTGATVPATPNHLFQGQFFTLPDNDFFSGRVFTGFLAQNLSINPAADSLAVDLSPYAHAAEFDLVAANNFSLAGDVTFSGFSAAGNIFFALIAGHEMWLAPGSSVTADIGNFEISAGGALDLDASRVADGAGNVRLTSGADISLENNAAVFAFGNASFASAGGFNVAGATVSADSLAITAGGALALGSATVNLNRYAVLSAAQGITLNDSTLNTSPGAGLISLNAKAGPVTISGTALAAHYLTVNSGDGILLNGSGGSLTASGSGAAANFTAPNLVAINHADFSSFATVNLAANTVNLSDVNFGAGSSVTLKSLLGFLNLGSSVPGEVNFIENVTYGGKAAQNYVNNGGGITVTTLH